MKIITQRQLIRNVANRWREQYFKLDDSLDDIPVNGKSKRQIQTELDSLDKEIATAQDINNIIGNGSWTRLRCDECGQEVETVLRVGEEPDYESQTACLCVSCVHAAQTIVTSPPPENVGAE